MKGQDIVLLLGLASLRDAEACGAIGSVQERLEGENPYSVRGLEALLGISKSEVNASLKRSLASGLAAKDRASGRPRPHRRNLRDFILNGLKFVFPAHPGALTRGVPTAFAAPMLAGLLVGAGEHIYVWPAADGKHMGQSVQPLFRTVPDAARRDERLYEYLALTDAIRLGNQREAGLAGDLLSKRLLDR